MSDFVFGGKRVAAPADPSDPQPIDLAIRRAWCQYCDKQQLCLVMTAKIELEDMTKQYFYRAICWDCMADLFNDAGDT
jgi:hypothetical protein